MSKPHRPISFEFFPPRTPEAQARLGRTCENLAELGPDFFSVTYGAGGSTRDKTLDTVVQIRRDTGVKAVPHISCIGADADEVRAVLNRYREQEFKHIVALRGDLPSGSVGGGSLRYANELVEFIRREAGDYFHIEVACYPEFHPQSPGAGTDLRNFKRKVDAGADGAITQYFYNPDAYFRFVDSCRRIGIEIPIVPGIMPIINCAQLLRFSESCGAEVPRWILKRLQDFGDDRRAIREFGTDVTTQLCRNLMAGGAPGLHFYTMNQFEASVEIWKNLDLGTWQGGS